MTVVAQQFNADGLIVRYGLNKAKQAQVGSPRTAGEVREVVCVVEASRMDLTGGLLGDYPNTVIPAGSWIKSATFVVTEAFDSGASATLDLGLGILDANGAISYTGGDEDGIDAAIAETALDTAGKAVLCDGAMVASTSAGFTTVDLYPSYDLDSIVYTTGKGFLVIEYIPRPYPDETAG